MFDSSLQTIANLAEIIGAGTIVTGLIFGVFQIREYKKRRLNAVAADLMRTFYSVDLAHAVSFIRLVPDGISAADLKAEGPEYERAAILISTTFETMGLLAFRRLTPFSLVQELAGGIIIVTWRKLSVWVETVREEQSQPSWAEWYQWLAEQLIEVKIEGKPAYMKFKGWQP